MTASTSFAPTHFTNPQDDFSVERLIPGFRPPKRPEASPDAATLRETERAAREWASLEKGPLDPASTTFAATLRDMFNDTFNPYRHVIAWPRLSPEEQARITSLPIWDIAGADRRAGAALYRLLCRHHG